MFYFKAPTRSDRPVLTDLVQAELDRRILFAPPGPLDPAQIPTYAQVRAELDGREVVSRRAVASIQAGPVPPALAALARLLASDFECVEVGSQQPPEDAEARDFRAADDAHPRAETVETGKNQESCKRALAFTKKTGTYPDPTAEQVQDSTYYGTAPLKEATGSGRKRRHKNDVPWPEKHFIQGHKVSKTLSSKEREWIDDALLRLKVLLGKGVLVCITLKPPHLDALGPVERMEYWEPFVNRFRSYRNSRCKTLKRPRSSWPVRCVWVRESDPDDDLGEHIHWIVWVPDHDEADHLIKHVRDTYDRPGWGKNTHAMKIDAKEEMVGGKLSSFFNYIIKAVCPRSRFADPTIGWQPSGALVGKRYFITKNLTDPEVVERTAVGVARLKRVRAEKKRAAFVRRAQANREGQYSYAAAAAELPAIEPARSEEADYLTHEADGAAGPVHREAERRDVPAEAPVQDDARAPARAEAQDAPKPAAAAEVHAEAPSAPVGLGTPTAAIRAVPVSASSTPERARSSRTPVWAGLGPAVAAPRLLPPRAAGHSPTEPRLPVARGSGIVPIWQRVTGVPPPTLPVFSSDSVRRAGMAGGARAPPKRHLGRCRCVQISSDLSNFTDSFFGFGLHFASASPKSRNCRP